MKKVETVFIVLCLWLTTQAVEAQNQIEKSILKKNRLYILESVDKGYFMGVKNPESNAYLRVFDLQKEHKPIYIDLFQPGQSPIYMFPNVWHIFDNRVYTISFAEGGTRVRPSFSIYKLPISYKDTLEMVKEKLNERKFVTENIPDSRARETYWLEKSEKEERYRNSRYIMPLLSLIESFSEKNVKIKKEEISYDFDIEKPSQVRLYIRDNKQLSIWFYNYPQDPDSESENRQWVHQTTYTNQPDFEYLKFYKSNEFIPDKNNIRLNSISDSLFYDGHIKVINQHDKTFLINVKHGSIYCLGKNNVFKIGQLILRDNSVKIAGRHLFVQDLDRGTLIFFTPVKFFGQSENLPSYEVILEREKLKSFFPYHNIF